MVFRKPLIFGVFALTTFLAGCGGKLSRSEAAEVLAEHIAETEDSKWISAVPRGDEASIDFSRYPDSISCLRGKGLVTRKTGKYDQYRYYLADPSSVLGSRPDYEDDTWIQLYQEKGEVEVTGVAQEDKGTAMVSFTWRHVPLSPFGECVLEHDLRDAATGETKTSFRKYDDGWRVEFIPGVWTQ